MGSSFKGILPLLICLVTIQGTVAEFEQACDHEIFCHGPLLEMVQMSGMSNDTKTFVDRPLRYPIEITQRNFAEFVLYHQNETIPVKEIETFVEYHFEKENTEFLNWTPPDWYPTPEFLNRISDSELRTFGDALHQTWENLGRRVRPEINDNATRWKYSMEWVPYPMVVPGGRFREFYYWDSYWIQKGLLHSEMYSTVEGIIRNFLHMVDTKGYVPNGNRIYYRRTQPPLLIPMVKNYLDATNNVAFVEEVLPILVKEFTFWDRNRSIIVTHNGTAHRMFRYNLERNGPRPEGYRHDHLLADTLLDEEQKSELYSHIHSACESGIDFSTRWFSDSITKKVNADNLNLVRTSTRHIIPADLNGFLYYNARTLAMFNYLVGDGSTGDYYADIADKLKAAINAVLWDEELGCWFDYNHVKGSRNKKWYPSNIVPLWAGAQESSDVVVRVMEYLNATGVTSYPGGTPSSLDEGEQWDFPNAWAPFEDLLVEGLEKSRNSEAQALAFELAEKWVWTNYLAYYFYEPKFNMYEKYDARYLGVPGGGGRYETVLGFGWSNGVVIDFLSKYGTRMVAPQAPKGAKQP